MVLTGLLFHVQWCVIDYFLCVKHRNRFYSVCGKLSIICKVSASLVRHRHLCLLNVTSCFGQAHSSLSKDFCMRSNLWTCPYRRRQFLKYLAQFSFQYESCPARKWSNDAILAVKIATTLFIWGKGSGGKAEFKSMYNGWCTEQTWSFHLPKTEILPKLQYFLQNVSKSWSVCAWNQCCPPHF